MIKIDKKLIIQIINSKNKKRKIDTITSKKACTNVKISYKTIKTTNISSLIHKVCAYSADLYPQLNITKNKDLLIELSNYLSQKINSQILVYRAVKSTIIVQFIARDCVLKILKNEIADIEQYINNEYGLNNLYKKEIQILPYLILEQLLYFIVAVQNKHKDFVLEIEYGAKQIFFNKQFTNAQIYGIAKYNKNLLKFTQNCTINIKKCIFYFIKHLDVYNQKLINAITQINKILKFTTFNFTNKTIN